MVSLWVAYSGRLVGLFLQPMFVLKENVSMWLFLASFPFIIASIFFSSLAIISIGKIVCQHRTANAIREISSDN